MPLYVVIEELGGDGEQWQLKVTLRCTDTIEHEHEISMATTFLQREPSEASLDWLTNLQDNKTSFGDCLETVHFLVYGSPDFQRLRWELLKFDGDPDPLAIRSTITRSTCRRESLLTTVKDFRAQTLNILLVTARTRGRSDIDYRTIARALVRCIDNCQSTCSLRILRPGTLKALQRELGDKGPGYYQIVHFDTHGVVLSGKVYAKLTQSSEYACSRVIPLSDEDHHAFVELKAPNPGTLARKQQFKDLVAASTLGELLNQYSIDVCLFNSCDSASALSSMVETISSRGIKIVSGMRHALSEVAATTVVQQIYTELLGGKSLTLAILAARRKLWQHKERMMFFGAESECEDWQLPILYAAEDMSYLLRKRLQVVTKNDKVLDGSHPTNYQDSTSSRLGALGESNILPEDDHEILGRDFEILELEYALLEEHNALLLRGLGGVGKSSLLKHLSHWWVRTDFCKAVFLYDFSSRIYTAEQLIDDLGREIFVNDTQFPLRSPKDQEKLLISACQNDRFAVILDNLEALTSPVAGAEYLNAGQQKKLRQFLSSLVKSSSFLLLGSRGEEQWLSRVINDNCQTLGGLDPAAASLLIRDILQQHGRFERATADDLRYLEKISSLLDRHPLAMKTVIGAVRTMTPDAILHDLRSNGLKLESQDDLLSCIQYSLSRIPQSSKERIVELAPLGTHIFLSDLQAYSEHLASALDARPRGKNDADDVPHSWSAVMHDLGRVGLATHVRTASDMIILHPSLPQFLHNLLRSQEESQGQPTMEQMQEALLTSVQEAMFPFADKLDLAAPVPTIIEMLRKMSFSYDNYRRALDVEVAHISSGDSSETPLMWVVFCLYFDQTSKFQEAITFDERILKKLDHRAKSTKLFISEILNHISLIQQQLQDRNAALKTLRDQLSILNAEEFTETSAVALEPGVIVQQVSENNSSLAVSRSKCYEQLANIAVASGKFEFGIKCQYLSLAWRRLSRLEGHVIRGLERVPLDFLSRLLPLTKDDVNARRCRFGYIIRSLEQKVWENVVSALIINRKIDAFKDRDLADVEALVAATIDYLKRGRTTYSLPDFYQFLLEIAIRQDSVEKATMYAERTLTILKQIGRDARETHLHMKLADWYEKKNNSEEARNSWQNAWLSIPPTGDLGDFITQEKALTGLLRTETRLGNMSNAKMFAELLEKRKEATDAIVRQTMFERGEAVSDGAATPADSPNKLDKHGAHAPPLDNKMRQLPSRISAIGTEKEVVQCREAESSQGLSIHGQELAQEHPLEVTRAGDTRSPVTNLSLQEGPTQSSLSTPEKTITEPVPSSSTPTTSKDASHSLLVAPEQAHQQPQTIATAENESSIPPYPNTDIGTDLEPPATPNSTIDATFWATFAEQIAHEAQQLAPTIEILQNQLDREVEAGENLLKDQQAFFVWLRRQIEESTKSLQAQPSKPSRR